jgi:Spy/CpxP family protein refolding chaperone
MRKFLIPFSVGLFVLGCGNEPSSPLADSGDLVRTALALSQTGMSGTVTVVREVALLARLPENLKLTEEQRAKVNQLVDAHASATRADRDALNSVAKRAMDAIAAGKSREEVIKILDEAKPIQQRLSAADAELIKNLTAVLTPAQSAWLQSQIPLPCDRTKFPPLTADQQRKIAALDSAFAVNNRADLEVAKAALIKAGEARSAGKSEAEVNAIMEAARGALDRLAAATKQLQEQIAAIYTPEQKASGCVFLG